MNSDTSEVPRTRLLTLSREFKLIACSSHLASTTPALQQSSNEKAFHRTGFPVSQHYPLVTISRSSVINLLAFLDLLLRLPADGRSSTPYVASSIQAPKPPFASSWNVSLGMTCKRMFAGGRGAASHARPPRCIATTKHILEPLMPQAHVSTMCKSIWSVPFPHHEGTVSFSPV